MIDRILVEDTVRSFRERYQLPGISVCFTDSYGEDYPIAAGVRHIASDSGLDPYDHLRVGSITKIFISTLILKMKDEGIVSLEQTVDSFLPGIMKDGTLITVRQLLQHRSGLKDYIWMDVGGTKCIQHAVSSLHDEFPPQNLIRLIATHDLQFEPGTEYGYSNTGYILLGMIAEKLTGKSIEYLLETWIIQPLQLERTYFPSTNDLREPFATGYSRATPDLTDLSDEISEITHLNVSIIWTAGAVISNPLDIQTFMKSLFNGQLLSKESLTEMMCFLEADDPKQSYGLGLHQYTFEDGRQAIGHQGGIHGYESVTLYYPDCEMSLTVIVNQMPVGVVAMTDQLFREITKGI
ncbi:serine hydrolase domain-containing protein [Rossellomorea aquimaris]|nr:serine hydrolase domain-containing protein [Rossellomorea aquimaris]WRP04549.1 serine hydrolase domain-containing protein [Rossellomorea aquimaris]